MVKRSLISWMSVLLVASCVVGCGAGKSQVDSPKLDPTGTTERVFKEFDKNSDGKLAKDELQTCPGLLSSVERFDDDKDGAISKSEFQAKLTDIERQGASLVTFNCVVQRGGVALQGATVKFVPESFLADFVKPASGVTGQDGLVVPSIPDEDLPAEFRGKVRGVPCGIFRVEVTHPSIAIPAKFNTQTTIGRLVSRRDHDTLTINL